MKAILTIYLFLILSVCLAGQTTNPFEIKNRLNKTSSPPENPFEVNVRNDTTGLTVNNSAISGFQDTALDTNQTPALAIVDNPFEVDHAPLRKSNLKEESAVKPRPGIKRKRITSTNEEGYGILVFLIGLVSLVLIAIVANTRRSIFKKITKSFYNDNYLKLTQREENGGLNGAYIILYIIYFLNAGVFLYMVANYFVPGTGFRWWMGILAVLGIYLVRHFALYLFSEIFPLGREAKQYNFIIATFNLLLGLILVPLNLIIAYTSPSISTVAIYSMLSVVAFVFFVRYAKGILIGLIASGGALFNFLLYLCTFEIVPMLILIKIVQEFGTYF